MYEAKDLAIARSHSVLQAVEWDATDCVTLVSESAAVFLSYASQDAAGAKRICDALRAAGIEVWLDTAELRGGDEWDQKIRRQIRDCALFLPIISAHTQARTEGYFRLEWHLADQRRYLMGRNRAFLVPVCIDDTSDKDADVPPSFLAVQWTRLPGGHSSVAFIERVGSLLMPSAAVQAPSAPAAAQGHGRRPPSTTRNAGRSRPRLGWKALLALIPVSVMLLGVGYWILYLRASPDQKTLVTSSAPVVTPSAVPEKSVAVLAFADMSEKKDQEYFSDGLTEEMIDLLSQLSDLRVPARTSSFYFKGKNETISNIAKQLSVANILEGSVRKAGQRLRITVQLIRAESGYHLWSQTYDRQDTDIFAVQDDIAKAVVTALRGKIAGGASALDSMRGTTNTAAYSEYLRGRAAREHQDTVETARRAVEAYERAIALDPNYGLAYAGLALAEIAVANFADEPTGIPRAEKHAEQAIALAPEEGRGYMARGFIRTDSLRDWVGAQADIRKALSLDPQDSSVQNAAAWLFAALGMMREAVQAATKVTDVDPLWVGGWQNLAYRYLENGDYEAAQVALDRAAEIGPTDSYQLYNLGTLRLLQGKFQNALEIFRKIKQDDGGRMARVAMAEHSLGHSVQSNQALDELIMNFAQVRPYSIAEVYAWRDEKDKAFLWLDRSYRQGGGMSFLKSDPILKTVRNDRRYRELLSKLQLPE